MKKKNHIRWLDEPEDHNYPAAHAYLSLIFTDTTAGLYVGRLKKAPVLLFKSKDIFRASGLPALPVTNLHVKKNQEKIQKGDELSPILLVRDTDHGRVIIADGYHRLCAVYEFDEDTEIPCKIV
jgi:hypothetical protein